MLAKKKTQLDVLWMGVLAGEEKKHPELERFIKLALVLFCDNVSHRMWIFSKQAYCSRKCILRFPHCPKNGV